MKKKLDRTGTGISRWTHGQDVRVNLLQKKGRSKRLFVRARSPVDLEDLSHILCQVPQKTPLD